MNMKEYPPRMVKRVMKLEHGAFGWLSILNLFFEQLIFILQRFTFVNQPILPFVSIIK